LPNQHTTEETAPIEAILVPLDLPDLHILSQDLLPTGLIRIEAIATSSQATCPRCQHSCVKIHDTRGRKKRDLALREHGVVLIVYKRRFHCLVCRTNFTEPDRACGRRKRTTARLREALGKRACTEPVEHVEHVAKAAGVSSRFVRECFEHVAVAIHWLDNRRSISASHKGGPCVVERHHPRKPHFRAWVLSISCGWEIRLTCETDSIQQNAPNAPYACFWAKRCTRN
jgi:hypothetical protein